ncbi:MAG: class I SAM-dependent methyltransferase [Verrucomicrobia bacterium]|nr:class I SAM-dependent methyltransferase [Verrucomicrobiota bacterium]
MSDIDKANREFYNCFGDSLEKIPFEEILPGLLQKYGAGKEVLEIGSGPGVLAAWLTQLGCQVTCLEPAEKPAAKAVERGLHVLPVTIQAYQPDTLYDSVIAISSLIHVPKRELPAQVEKIANVLKPSGLFFVTFIEGDQEGLEDPTETGKFRHFSKWSEKELERLLSPFFGLLESHRIYRKKMGCTFLLRVYQLIS